ncbi:MAG: DUF4102 domain-containing protein [Gammaproteobacteria bacterium]|nr:MAG: DUF4102 domain-containing protein [Gammaproteobacteria bacterium]
MLNDTEIKTAKPRQKPYKLADERGLYLLVTKTGARSWRFKCRSRLDNRRRGGRLAARR